MNRVSFAASGTFSKPQKSRIGSIKDLEKGAVITYTTVHGTRTYEVVSVKTISNSDWSDLQATSDNRITLTTCPDGPHGFQ